MDHYFCPFCNLYPVEYVYDLNIFPFLHVFSTCIIRKNIYYKNMFRELHQTSNREHNKGSSGRKYAEYKFSTDNIPGIQKYKIVIDELGINKKLFLVHVVGIRPNKIMRMLLQRVLKSRTFPPMIKIQSPEQKKYLKFISFCGRKILIIF